MLGMEPTQLSRELEQFVREGHVAGNGAGMPPAPAAEPAADAADAADEGDDTGQRAARTRPPAKAAAKTKRR
jgi:hypothetical protein